jgi:CubicO group peptidase (beta-lactamase class C family)
MGARMTSPRAYPRVVFLFFVVFGMAVAHGATSDPLPRAQPEEVGLSSERLQQLSTVMKRYVEDGQVAGSVVLVARRGKLAYLEAFGQRDREARSPMRTDSMFRIASQTKAIVSVGAMMLVEEGKLLLTDPVSKYLPEFRETTVAVPKDGGTYDVVKAKRPITVRDLLTHTSGISYGEGPAADKWKAAGIQGWYFADRNEPVAATVSRMAALPFDSQPGERWVYGYNTDVLGAVLERVSGMSLDQFLRTRITGPLGMTDTAFYVPADKRERLATVYSRKPNGGGIERAASPGTLVDGALVGQGAYVEGPRKAFSGGAGLISTAGDYARFLQMMLNAGTLDGKRLVSRKTVELMTTDHLAQGVTFRPGVGFGLGFSVVTDVGERGDPGSLGEFGWGGAYHSTYWVDPKEQLIVVYLTQLIPARELDDYGKVRALVYHAIVD